MKIEIYLAIFVLSGFSALASTETRSDILDRIIEAQGLKKLAESTRESFYKESKEAARLKNEQMKKTMPDVPEHVHAKLQEAGNQYTTTIAEAWNIDESMEVWKQAYGEKFTDAELLQILDYIKSPLGQKELAASQRAVHAWRNFIFERQKIAAEKAIRVQSEAVQKIFAENPKK